MISQPENRNDSRLVLAARVGDACAFEQLIQRYFGTVYAIAYARTWHRETAEDLAQEVFLRAFLSLERLGSPGRFAGWICQITHHLATDWLRRGQTMSRFIPTESLEDVPEEPRDENAVNARERLQRRQQDEALRAGIEGLPPELREVVLLHYTEGLSQKDIAARLEVHPATVGRQLQKALQCLKGSVEGMLRESGPSLRAPKHAMARSAAAVIGVSSLAASAKAALAAEVLRTTVGYTAAGSGGSAASAGFLESVKSSIISGGTLMAGAKGTVVVTVAVAALLGGVYHYRETRAEDARKAREAAAALERGQRGVSASATETGGNGHAADSSSNSQAVSQSSHTVSARSTAAAAGTSVPARVTVKVFEWDDSPAGEAVVTVTYPDGREETARADRTGEASISVLPSSSFVVSARNDHGAAAVNRQALSPGTRDLIPLTLRNEATISGKVTSPDGKPVAGAKVVAFPMRDEKNRLVTIKGAAYRDTVTTVGALIAAGMTLPAAGIDSSERGVVAAQGVTNGDGSYKMKPLLAGRLAVSMVTDKEHSYAAAGGTMRVVILDPGRSIGGIDFTAEQGDYLEGVVLDPERKLVEGAAVTVLASRSSMGTRTQSDAEGRSCLSGIRTDSILGRLRVSHQDYETRDLSNVDPMNGNLEIILAYNAKVVLVAVDSGSGQPVENYRYRMLRETYSGLNPDLEDRGVTQEVHNPKGEVALKGFAGRQLVAQVSELDGAGMPTGRRGSRRFEVAVSDKAKRIEVPVGDGFVISGSVIEAGTSAPVAGATIGVEQMRHWLDHRTLPLDENFDPKDTQSGNDGRFRLGPVLPGRYTLTVNKGKLKPEQPVVVEISEDRTPKELQIVLGAGGVIGGHVAYKGGKVLSGAKIRMRGIIPGAVQDATGEAATDGAGNYRFEKLQIGDYRLELRDESVAVQQRQQRTFVTGVEEKVVNWELAEPILLEGKITIGGKPPAMIAERRPDFHLLPADGRKRIRIPVQDNGEYKLSVLPGDYQVTAGNMTGWWWEQAVNEVTGGVFGEVTVTAGPSVQTKDFDLVAASAKILVGSREGEQFRKGSVEVSQRLGRMVRDRLFYQVLTSPNGSLPLVPPGEYKASFRSTDGLWMGESAWTRVEPGKENILTILVHTPQQVQVGAWSPASLHSGTDTLAWDVTPHVKGGGTVMVIFDYKSGHNGVQISDVALLQGNVEVARDVHLGWAGTAEVGNIFRLELPRVTPGAAYTLQAVFESRAGTDSLGNVILCTGLDPVP